MFNKRSFTGSDGVLTLSDADPFDPDTFTNYFGESGVVGRVVNVKLQVRTRVSAFYEMGARTAKELRPGHITVFGSVERAYVNGAMLRLMLGQYAESEENEIFRIPTFNMSVALDRVDEPGDEGSSVLTAFGVIFDTWQMDFPEDDFALERMTFKARRVTVLDNEVSS